jgi:hypothetical protein
MVGPERSSAVVQDVSRRLPVLARADVVRRRGMACLALLLLLAVSRCRSRDGLVHRLRFSSLLLPAARPAPVRTSSRVERRKSVASCSGRETEKGPYRDPSGRVTVGCGPRLSSLTLIALTSRRAPLKGEVKRRGEPPVGGRVKRARSPRLRIVKCFGGAPMRRGSNEDSRSRDRCGASRPRRIEGRDRCGGSRPQPFRRPAARTRGGRPRAGARRARSAGGRAGTRGSR